MVVSGVMPLFTNFLLLFLLKCSDTLHYKIILALFTRSSSNLNSSMLPFQRIFLSDPFTEAVHLDVRLTYTHSTQFLEIHIKMMMLTLCTLLSLQLLNFLQCCLTHTSSFSSISVPLHFSFFITLSSSSSCLRSFLSLNM